MGGGGEREAGRRVVVFPLPLQGHMNPALRLASLLQTEGFSVTVIQTRYNSLDIPSRYPHLAFRLIEDGLSSCETALDPSDPWAAPSALNRACPGPFRECLARILSEGGPACLIADSMWLFVGDVAEGLGLPRITFRTCSMCSFAAYNALPLLCRRGYFPVPETQLDERVPELPPLRFKDLPSEQHHARLTKTIERAKASQGYICNTFEELESSWIAMSQQQLPVPVFSVGPLHVNSPPSSRINIHEQDRSSLSWLDEQAPNSVLYISFGSLATMSKEEFLEISWGLANSGRPFLWVVRPGLVQGLAAGRGDDPFPEGFWGAVEGRGKTVKWAPQEEVLAHHAVAGFWTHTGWNSTLESVCEGVPMICTPFFADQPINARHLSEDGVGVALLLEKGTGRGEVERVIRRLMVDKEGEEIRERVSALREKARLCLMEGGSSYKSLKRLTSHILSL